MTPAPYHICYDMGKYDLVIAEKMPSLTFARAACAHLQWAHDKPLQIKTLDEVRAAEFKETDWLKCQIEIYQDGLKISPDEPEDDVFITYDMGRYDLILHEDVLSPLYAQACIESIQWLHDKPLQVKTYDQVRVATFINCAPLTYGATVLHSGQVISP